MTHDYEEKRLFFRMRLETEVSFSVKGQTNKTYRGVSQDLSAAGLLMHSDFPPELDTELSIEITTDNDRLPPFVAEGKVIRVEPNNPQPGRYLISVALTATQ